MARNDAFKRRGALDCRSPAVVKLDPAFIEAIEHSDPWQGVAHALSAEDPFPIVTRHDLDRHRPCQHVREALSEIVRRRPDRPFQLDDPRSAPFLAKKCSGKLPDIPWCRPSGMPCRPAAGSFAARLVLDDPSVAISACLAGNGIFQSLTIGLAPFLSHGELVPILPEWSEELYPLYAYHHSRHLPPAKVRAFLDFVQEVAAGL